MDKPPWIRKIERAEHHLAEIQEELRLYDGRHPYLAIRDVDANPNPRVYVYRAQLVNEPRDDLDLMVGDCTVNLRSALDHLVVNITPVDRSRSFPITTSDPFRRDPETGEYIAPDRDRTLFLRGLSEVPEDAIEIIKGVQPWHTVEDEGIPTLDLLNWFANGHKHKQIRTVAYGIKDPVTTLTIGGFTLTSPAKGSARNGEEVATFAIRRRDLREFMSARDADRLLDIWENGNPEVKAEIEGTPLIAVSFDRDTKDPDEIPRLPVGDVLAFLISIVRDGVVGPLEPFTK